MKLTLKLIKVNNMILANGTKVFLTGGHYKDQVKGVGEILTHRNSARDGDSYIIEFGHPIGKVQIKAKFVREALEEVESEAGVQYAKPQKHRLEGKWVETRQGVKVFEESDSPDPHLVLSKHNKIKNVLVTLVYEDYGTLVANVVFQGQYAVVPVDSLFEHSNSPGNA